MTSTITCDVLRAWREARRLTKSAMTNLLCQAARDLGQYAGPRETILRYIDRWEDPANPRLPTEQRQLWYVHALGLSSVTELRAGPPDSITVTGLASAHERHAPATPVVPKDPDTHTATGASHELSSVGMASYAAIDDELAAMDFMRRAQASDVGNEVCEQLELAVDDLATAYPSTLPVELLTRTRAYLSYISGLADAKATLTQRRRLLVAGGWMSLLAATSLIDLHRDRPAAAYLSTASQLALETGHAELAAWCAETQAWQFLTAGAYQACVEMSRKAQEIAPRDSSAYIQATAQEGRAWARLGDSRQTRASLAAVEHLVSPLPRPKRPEHHYVYDPVKARVYIATTLTWLHDSAAEPAARDILSALEHPIAEPPRPRRIALARLDLGLALTTAGKHDEAASVALGAIRSGRLAPVDAARVREIVAAVSGHGVPEGRELTEAYRTENGRWS